MPLSEHEQKMLEQMERALYAEDPKFASSMKGRERGGPPRRRLLLGLCAAAVGLGLVVAGVTIEMIWLGGIGFAVMVAGVAWAFGGSHESRTGTKSAPARGQSRPSRRKTPRSSSFMQRMENRWEDRRREQG